VLPALALLIGEWFSVHPSRVLLTNGQLNGLALLAWRFLPGRSVLIEYPIHDRAERVLLGAGASLTAIPVGPEGLVIEELHHVLGMNTRPAMVHAIPSFNNPTGWTTPADSRARIVDLVITELGVFEIAQKGKDGGLTLIDIAPDVTVEETRSKTEAAFLAKRNPRKFAWTIFYRKMHKKGLSEETQKKKSRRAVKFERAIVGASLDVIKAKRNVKPEVREKARAAALQEIKDRKKAKAATKVTATANKQAASKNPVGKAPGRVGGKR